MVQIIQSGPSAQTLRQQAFQQGLDQIGQSLNAWANLSEQRTQREQALNEKKNQNALELIKARIAAGEELTPQEEAFVNSNMPQQLVAQSPQAIQSEQPASEDVQGAIGKLFAQQTQSAANPETKYDEAGNIIGSKFPISETAKEISKKSALNQAGYYDPSNGRLQYDSTGLLISPYDPKKRLDQQPQQETQQTSQGRKLTPRKQAEVDKIKAQTAIDTYKAKQYELPIEQRDDFKKAVALKKVEVKSANSPNEIQFKSLPKDKQETIEVLAKKNANKISIANQIDAVMKTWDTLSDDQKVYQGRQLLKTLNSPEGADAIGSEEANRLGSNLEFALGNLTNSNPFQLGRDLEGFKEQAMGTSQSLKDAISSNKALIDEAYGRAPSKAISKTQEDELKELEMLRAKKAGKK